MGIRHTQLHPEKYYHIYNRGVNKGKVFFDTESYHFFLRQYARYAHPFLETFAYCLLPNHFHLLTRVKSEQGIHQQIKADNDQPAYRHISDALSYWLKSYTQAINKKFKRTGALFERPFKRKLVEEEAYFSQLIAYIHLYPQIHGLFGNYKEYPHSSYKSHLTNMPSKLNRTEVLDWFGGLKQYHDFHESQADFSKIESLILE
ncbi:hypothetical protein N6H18_05560 [Reichenbachiella agarivorans]|uniref:Transposase IS200-like domain-containing protein n=1 Tax=Reichenbachiella agarivorans TaxID=2979464 RepID=A0ABY6CVJ6_9BACT|nr:hypothetical protein [Reichenbachiella agarivorans]UXP33418.1 hypothetical protein N6H18_05560 [Reichenbachiella agarivorans]